MLAFGCEESGRYRLTEEHGCRALEIEPRNAWAHNALAIRDWWHLALFHLDQGEIDAALALFGGPIPGLCSAVTVDLIDASSLLWRLQLRGVDVRERWRSFADLWRQVAVPGLYAFNDLHAIMAWNGSGDRERSERWIAALAAAVGTPLLRGFDAWGRGENAAAIESLSRALPEAQAIGGSHAQRQVIALTLEAAQQAARTAPAVQPYARGLSVASTAP